MSVRETVEPKSSLWAWLAFDLWFYRTQRGLSLAQVGLIVKAARGTVSNWEAGRRRPKNDHMKRLDDAWDTGGHFQRLLYYACTGHDPDWFKQYIQYESAADVIKVYHGQSLPVPVQTTEYARSLLSRGAGAEDIEGALEVRIKRQETLRRAAPPRLWILFDEAVLNQMVGGRDVMRDQMRRLLELRESPNVVCRVVPFSAGAHPGLDGPFQVLTVGGRDIAYAGAQIGGRLIEGGDEVNVLRVRFDEIGAEALSRSSSVALIERRLEELS
ncbi:helix-turn-helix transcriptional regulator [Actinomadura sp. NTSP31]|uniref:helix-turn-helix domain-containing protein n=1 Tax=Actinomadura sp. NTSP31 TaxID=1735447 RepID=UPI0035C01965